MKKYRELKKTIVSIESVICCLFLTDMVWIAVFHLFLDEYILILFLMGLLSNIGVFLVLVTLVNSALVTVDVTY